LKKPGFDVILFLVLKKGELLMTEKKIPNLENAIEIKRVVNGYFGDPKGCQ